jgi:hypothetical protein
LSSNNENKIDYKDFEADIVDKDVYDFLSVLEKNEKLENCIALKVVVENDDFNLKDSLVVLDFFV